TQVRPCAPIPIPLVDSATIAVGIVHRVEHSVLIGIEVHNGADGKTRRKLRRDGGGTSRWQSSWRTPPQVRRGTRDRVKAPGQRSVQLRPIELAGASWSRTKNSNLAKRSGGQLR